MFLFNVHTLYFKYCGNLVGMSTSCCPSTKMHLEMIKCTVTKNFHLQEGSFTLETKYVDMENHRYRQKL